MNKVELIQKIACWAGYCLFAGYSAYMTSKSVAMSFELNQVWVVFIFVFTVALLAGWCLSVLISQLKNRFNPSKSKFLLSLLGFLLFWSVSFATNVHYMLMSNEGLKVVSAELGVYKNYVERTVIEGKSDLSEYKERDIRQIVSEIKGRKVTFEQECDATSRPGFDERAMTCLKSIESHFTSTKAVYGDFFDYENKIFHEEKDRGDMGKTARKEVEQIKRKYLNRINYCLEVRIKAIQDYYKMKIPQTKNFEILKGFINDSLYVVDIPQISEIATPDVYYQFQKEQLLNNVYNRLSENDKTGIDKLIKEYEVAEDGNVDAEKYRYKVYPSSRMFSTFNVWDDMFHHRLPHDMRLLGWILFSLIIDIIAFILRILA